MYALSKYIGTFTGDGIEIRKYPIPGDRVTLGWAPNQWPGDMDRISFDDMVEGLNYFNNINI
ncbi:hypothetical protein EHV15_13880 [Paenibacillus oralis]|uniref:Uncharacterized protein n=1 Tax=Paenibacillus oralis TaxID=2490856 RepID=A0A3P3U2N6_9BACL|nr:hypothetical protein [Paenibacillus oralis]RRJ63899.1 hypothetical protein EHV15_13880 [Paenibacillus oralis]